MNARLYIISLLLLPLAGLAQYNYQPDYQQKFDNLGWEDGLPDERILDIEQDAHGLMWFATPEGLVRYDGYTLRVFNHKDGDSTSLSGNYITDIAADNEGNLWIGTKSGLNRYDYQSGEFGHFRAEPYNPKALRSNYVRALAVADSLLWIETADGTLTRMQIATGKMQHFKHEPITQPYYDYHSILPTAEKIWLGGRNMGPIWFNRKTQTFGYIKARTNDSTKKRDQDVACFFKDSHKQFWVSATDGLYRFWPETGRFQKFLQTSTFSIAEDQTGRLWFATGNGVYAFNRNSRQLVHYRYSGNNRQGLAGNHINKVYSDRSGTIWLGTNSGISRLSMHKFKFRHIYHIPGNKHTLAGNHVTALMRDKQNRIWVGTDGNGLDVFNRNLLKLGHFEHYPEKKQGLAANKIRALYQDSAGMIWIGLWRGVGFNRYNPQTGKFRLYSYSPQTFKNDWYNDFLEDSHGRFWLGFWGAEGAMLFDRKTGKFTGRHFFQWQRPMFKRITRLAAGPNTLWLVANRRTLYRFCPKANTFLRIEEKTAETHRGQVIHSRYRHEIIRGISNFGRMVDIVLSEGKTLWIAGNKRLGYVPEGADKVIFLQVPSNTGIINDVTLSKDGNVYLATSTGLWRYNSAQEFFRRLYAKAPVTAVATARHSVWFAGKEGIYRFKGRTRLPVGQNKQFTNQQITSLLPGKQELWIGTVNGLYQYFWQQDSLVSHVRKKANCKNCISDNYIHALHREPNGQLWIATDKGLNLFNEAESTFRQYYKNPTPGGLYSDRIFALTSLNNQLFLASDKGLLRTDSQQRHFRHYNTPPPQGLSSRLVTCFYEDSHGDIWIGSSDNGLNQIIGGKNHIRHYSVRYPENHGFTAVAVNTIHETTQNALWVGTDAGLYRFQRPDSTFRKYGQAEGFPGSAVQAILSAGENALWIAAGKKLVHFIPGDTAIVYNRADGLQPGKFTPAATTLPDGRLLFGGENGLTVVDKQAITPNPHMPKVAITGFQKMRKPMHHFLPHEAEITLSHQENFFTILFSALDYNAPENNQYRYKLHGVDHDWITQTGKPRAAYTDVDPGTYRFEVFAANNDGLWSKTPSVLTIDITPPFWQTFWFYFLIAAIAGATASYLIYLRISKLKSDKRSLQLEQQLLMSQMNPHFIFNSLTSIQNFVMKKETLKASHYLARFARLIRFILNHSRERLVTVEREKEMLQHFLALQKMRFAGKFDYSITIDKTLDADFLYIPPMIVQPYVENAVKHAFPSDEAQGFIEVYFYREAGKVNALISDNGIGIDRSRKQKQQNTHSSLGMRITRERIENLNKLLYAPVKIRINDRSRDNVNQTGTQVHISFPVIDETMD